MEQCTAKQGSQAAMLAKPWTATPSQQDAACCSGMQPANQTFRRSRQQARPTAFATHLHRHVFLLQQPCPAASAICSCHAAHNVAAAWAPTVLASCGVQRLSLGTRARRQLQQLHCHVHALPGSPAVHNVRHVAAQVVTDPSSQTSVLLPGLKRSVARNTIIACKEWHTPILSVLQ